MDGRAGRNVVENKIDYIIRLRLAIQHLHNCSATWIRTETVHETFEGKTVWLGEVEVFAITGHPQANRCYSWSHCGGAKEEPEKLVAILRIPPVVDAKTAVQASIVKDVKSGTPD